MEKVKGEMLNVEIGQPVEISVTGKLHGVLSNHNGDGVIYRVELRENGRFVAFVDVTKEMIVKW